MKILKFKTNINSEAGVKEVSSYLDKDDAISKWDVDTKSQDNILSVSGEELEPYKVKNLVEQAGFQAEVIRIQGIGGGDI